ncbi:putative U4/U6 small nuclear ribonuclear protein [Trypanosoma theileri]|uniref:Putative U4/U6 small nuclear ribonuclear protein n=1 Tax=Trypanosoma theileri TaxID=67003 RepID=A0A1X0NYH8_9TRYP|nr:putative U4/U6 small nuclear ribonuclear protein [Trypanosoma theileri]ORC89523.1 putative U4/U6 small nuclear ribonuclear protein [Trypanosoma theileri]
MELVDPVIPSTDREVQEGLRMLEAPIFIFAETAAERRRRLHKLMIEGGFSSVETIRERYYPTLSSSSSAATLQQYGQKPNHFYQQDGNYQKSVSQTIPVQTKAKYTQASPELVAKRTALLPLTLARAERRIAKLKEAFVASPAVIRPAYQAALEQLRSMKLVKSVRNVKIENGNNGANRGNDASVVGTLCMPFTCCAAVPTLPRMVLTGAADGVVTLWDIDACLPHASVSTCDNGWGRVQHLAAHPTSSLFFSTTMFDTRIATWCMHEEVLNGSGANNNNDNGNGDGDSINNKGNNKTRGKFSLERVGLSDSHHTARIQRLAVDPTGSLLASTSDDSTLRLWDITTSTCMFTSTSNTDTEMIPLRYLHTQDAHATAGGTLDVSFHPDGSLLAATDRAGRVVVWDVRCGAAVHIAAGAHGGHLNRSTCVAWSPCGVRFASGGADNVVHVWDVRVGATSPWVLAGHTDVITSLQFCGEIAGGVLPAGLSSTALDGTVRLWDVDKGGACAAVLRGAAAVRSQCWPAAGAPVLFTVAHSKYWSLWGIRDVNSEVVLHETTDIIQTGMAVTLQQKDGIVGAGNEEEEDDEGEDEEEEDDDDDEMMALRKRKVEVAQESSDGVSASKNDARSNKVEIENEEEDEDDDEEDEMSFLKKR